MIKRISVFIWIASLTYVSLALDPVEPEYFYRYISYSDDVQLGEWNGRSDLCIKKAKETGYLMLWFLSAYTEDSGTCKKFLETQLCRQAFCNLINSYKYIILCCEDYSDSEAKARKDSIYGFVSGGKIKDESTGEMVENWNGYPRKNTDSYGIVRHCDPPPSLTLLKFDSSANILFHVYGYSGNYDEKFSPYASQFPIPTGMNKLNDKFAPWLQQYLDMFPVESQIESYENAGGSSQGLSDGITTNYIYEIVDIFITETVNPTVFQIAQHRDNLLFRGITTIKDILIKNRINDEITPFDDNVKARNWIGKWFVNHDDTISAISDNMSDGAAVDIIPTNSCLMVINQRFGNGFSLREYEFSPVTNIVTEPMITATGTTEYVTSTNITVETGSLLSSTNVNRNVFVEKQMSVGLLYRISVSGNATFDVFSTK